MSETDASPVLTDKIADFSTRKLELIEGAAEVFARAGYHGCSMRDVAERIGIRQSSIYHHFRSKDEMLLAICTYGGEAFLRNIRAIRAEKNGTRLAKIEAVIRAHITPYVLRQHYAYSFVFMRQHLTGKAKVAVSHLSRAYEQELEELLCEGMESGELDPGIDVRMATFALIGMCNSVSFWARREPGISLDRVAMGFAHTLIQGLRAR
ncbi:MAG: TetR/AcrR family transcriptional regulator [Ideonella sp.]|jgi:AcrR family transcriptional regulator|nr:TetR/AcrR family transcriptional regulator [Ideonella sp.]